MKLNFLFLFFLLTCQALPIGAVEAGKTAPTLVGKYLESDPAAYYSLSMEPGKWRVFNFFSTVCEPCRAEIPEYAALSREYPDVSFFLVNAYDEKPEQIRRFLDGLKDRIKNVLLSSPNVRDRFTREGDPGLILPATFVIGPGNVIKLAEYGYNKELILKIKEALGKE